jgi:hypothetical protein
MILYKKLEGCMLSRIVGRNITHQVIRNIRTFRLKIVSAGYGRCHESESIFRGTYEECLRFLNKKRFDRW